MNTASTDDLPELSERETEVAALLMQGLSNKQIAHAMGIATRTVEFHTGHIYKKLGVASRSEAVAMLAKAHLRESAGDHLRQSTGGLRPSTVENRAVSSENEERLKPVFRRNRMRTFFIVLMGIAAVALVSIAVFTAISLTAGLALWNSNQVMPPAGTPPPTYTPYQPTYTPYQPTYTPYEPTRTPIVPTPTPYDPFATTIITTLSPLLSADGRWTYEGVSFAQDAALAGSASGLVIAAKPAYPDSPFWEIYPQHVRIALEDYPLAETAWHPHIAVFPVEEYRQSSPLVAEKLDELEDLLARHPADEARLPFLPPINYTLGFHSGVQYFDFQNGSGVRYLAILGQAPAPVNNKELFYKFQGFTSDGRHFISIVMPIQHPALLASPDDQTQEQFEAMLERFDQYRAESATMLDAQPPSSFTPALDAMDALVQSVRIDR
jgi:DNA-binding CsgD family transcriptional regulator